MTKLVGPTLFHALIHCKRYRYILEELNVPIFGVLKRLQKARYKECGFKETFVPVGECSTLVSDYVINGGADEDDPNDNLEDHIRKIALYGVMIDENRIVYRTRPNINDHSDRGRCKICIKNRKSGKITHEIQLNHDHDFKGLCAIDMSTYGIVTTDGPHTLWAPREAQSYYEISI